MTGFFLRFEYLIDDILVPVTRSFLTFFYCVLRFRVLSVCGSRVLS